MDGQVFRATDYNLRPVLNSRLFSTRGERFQVQHTATHADAVWLRYVQDADWLPYEYDVRADTLVFAHLPREAQRRAVFLDPRFLARAPKSDPAPLASLPTEAIREQNGKLHFIFHTAFCCSTLLTRALDVPGVSMGVKEPSVLVGFARHFGTGRRTPGALSALSTTLDLLSRPLTPGETQIIKPSNTTNHIIPTILHARPDAKALILYSSLDAFLRAVARRGLDGREFARLVFSQSALAIPLEDDKLEDPFLQTDLQIAARAWLMQSAFITQVAERFGPDRVRTLNCDTMLASKANTLKRVADFFDLGLDSKTIADIADGPVFREHAKHPALAFDTAAYQAQHEEAGSRYFEEVNAVRAWARTLAQRTDAPLSLGDSLMDAGGRET